MSVKQIQEREAALEKSGVETPLYAPRQKIYPQSVKGRLRTIKWVLLFLTLGVYYFLPFVRWDRGLDAPSQAVLVDLEHRRFYFFFIEIWPQEFYYLTGLLIIAALTLFLMNAVAGRLWCGYLCPQTVWTDLFLWVERLTEGDRRERMQNANKPWDLESFARAILKHWAWLMIAWWTGGAWVLYFTDAPTLVYELVTYNAPFTAYLWIGILTITTYFFAGHMREQVCTYMCPWPRIQAALTDEWALNVTYRYDRGEPRGSVKKVAALKSAGKPAGDCVDCNQCFNVCPTGVDIRDGLQIDCIQCGLCIDACDNIMTKIGRPTGLIGYDTDINVKLRQEGKKSLPPSIIRPRTILYAGLIAVIGVTMLYALVTRSSIALSILHDRNPLFVKLSDGSIRNAYTLRVANKYGGAREFSIKLERFDAAHIDVVGAERDADGWPRLKVGPDQTLETRILVSISPDAHPPRSQDIRFVLRDINGGETAIVKDHFISSDEHH